MPAAADAVVYDRLADPRILAFARKDAEMVYVGKASANHTMRQPDINKLLVKLAAEGKVVARLKGGDPFVFGRGAITAALADGETEILGAECVNISYPDFYQDLEKLAH